MKQDLRLDTSYLERFVSKADLKKIFPEVKRAHTALMERKGAGKDFLGWMDLPDNINDKLIKEIKETAKKLADISDVLLVIGIGGSYLGARAIIEALLPGTVGEKIIFVGNNLCGADLKRVLESIKDKEVTVNVVSKSGTTTEPAVAFRIIEDFLKKKYSNSLSDRIVCTTDKRKGALKKIADMRKYKTFVIPDDVGGRFSVLSPVGLLPAAAACVDISALIEGARAQRKVTGTADFDKNLSCKYAAVRNILYRKGKRIEILSNFDGTLHYMAEWWKQLFGESEGKKGRGIFPSSCDFSTDLHSVGQLIQEGERNIFETFLIAERSGTSLKVPRDKENLDALNYLAGMELDYINHKAYEATAMAHYEGGVPNSTVYIPEKNAFYLGKLFYFFEMAVAVSGYLFGVNPFDQPGVDAYKNNMFKLLGKPA